MDIRASIIRALADGCFHSGESLANTFGVSRAAIWKHLSKIRDELGIEIFSVRGRGYRLAAPLELLDQRTILKELSGMAAERISYMEVRDQVDSTNRHLMDLASHGIPSGYVCLTERQTAGRGRLGRTWISPFGSNIYLSIYWNYSLDLAGISGLSLAAGIAVVRALERLGLKGIGLKWPNDILWDNRKLAGLLLEARGEQGGPTKVVVGIGLNRYLHESHAQLIDQPWVDLAQIPGGYEISRNLLTARLLDELVYGMSRFQEKGFAPLTKEWREYDVYQGETVSLQIGGKSVIGTHCGVDEHGALLLKEAGRLNAYHGGELGLRLLRRV